MKKEFWTYYDYGMGVIWFVVYARSEFEIVEKFPMLNVSLAGPKNMSSGILNIIREKFTFDIDDGPNEDQKACFGN